MKKLWVFFIAIAIVSCKTEESIEYAILDGKITNTTAEKVTLYNAYDTGIKKEIILKNGQFTDTVKINNGNMFFLREDKNSVNLFLQKGDLLNLTYDSKKLDSTLLFKGENSAISTYITEASKNVRKLAIDTQELYSKSEAQFINQISNIKKPHPDF
jgi:hypothetical protein